MWKETDIKDTKGTQKSTPKPILLGALSPHVKGWLQVSISLFLKDARYDRLTVMLLKTIKLILRLYVDYSQ